MIPKLKEPGINPNVTVNIMAAIGELAQVAGMGLRPWVNELCPIIMEMLQDASSIPKREVKLVTCMSCIHVHMLGCLMDSWSSS